MHERKKIEIRVIAPVGTNEYNEAIQHSIEEVLAPDVEIGQVRNLPHGATKCIEGREAIAINTPYVIALVKQAAKDGCDGVFVSDMDFCGVEAEREVVDIPVIGGFRANAFTAMSLASRFSIITILDSVVAMQREHIRSFGIEPNFASIRTIDLPVAELSDRDKVVAAVHRTALSAIEQDGAEAIILGCTGFVGVAKRVAELLAADGLPAPVLDPNQVGISFLTMLIRNRLSQSRLTYMHQPGLDERSA